MDTNNTANQEELPLHYDATVILHTSPEKAFEYLDDPKKLSAHMGKSSWMMAGSKMSMDVDGADGRSVGSEIRMRGQMMGISLSLREAISERIPGKRKVWKTTGIQELVVIDQYQMGFELAPAGPRTELRVFIDYSLPRQGVGRLLGHLFAKTYARWCTEMMAKDAARFFSTESETHASRDGEA